VKRCVSHHLNLQRAILPTSASPLAASPARYANRHLMSMSHLQGLVLQLMTLLYVLLRLESDTRWRNVQRSSIFHAFVRGRAHQMGSDLAMRAGGLGPGGRPLGLHKLGISIHSWMAPKARSCCHPGPLPMRISHIRSLQSYQSPRPSTGDEKEFPSCFLRSS